MKHQHISSFKTFDQKIVILAEQLSRHSIAAQSFELQSKTELMN